MHKAIHRTLLNGTVSVIVDILVNRFPDPILLVDQPFFLNRAVRTGRVDFIGSFSIEPAHSPAEPKTLGGYNAAVVRSKGLAENTGIEYINRLICQAFEALVAGIIKLTGMGKTFLNFFGIGDQGNLNPVDNALMATMVNNFSDSRIPGKMQFGSGWWFLDQKYGMTEQMNTLSSLGLLSRFVGMLTDSRSFLSYPRHEYFRRILCQLVGRDIENGEIPNDPELTDPLIKNVCYLNAKNYFRL